MSAWQRTLDIVEDWKKASEYEIAHCQLAGIIAEKLAKLEPFTGRFEYVEDLKNDLIEEFQLLSEDENLDLDEFNCLMSSLYSWADMRLDSQFGGKAVCWVKTQF